jgi:predicted nucleic acid-binding protein
MIADAGVVISLATLDKLDLDKQTRRIAEQHGINCFGTLAVLLKARSLNLIGPLRLFFVILLAHNRYYKKTLLNSLLVRFGEKPLDE